MVVGSWEFEYVVASVISCVVLCVMVLRRRVNQPGIVVSIPVEHFVFIPILFVIGIIVKCIIDGAKQHLPNAAIRRSGVNYVPVSNISNPFDI